MKKEHTILIVDDTPDIIEALGEILKDYHVLVAIDGETALQIVKKEPKLDLILLDIIMPGMDGYKVCEALKNDPTTNHIPVIFITVMGEEREELKGFALGAVDYISKPFSPMTVRARVETHLDLKDHKDNLEMKIRERTEQLIHADKLATLGVMSAYMAHEVRSPLSAILQYVDLARTRVYDEEIKKNLSIAEECNISFDDIKAYVEKRELLSIFDTIGKIGVELSSLLTNMLSFSRKNSTASEYNLEDLLNESLALVINDPSLKKNIDFDKLEIIRNFGSVPAVHCDSNKLQQVFFNIMKNSVQATASGKIEEKTPCLTLLTKCEANMVCIEIKDNGVGMDRETRDNIFEPFFTTKEKEFGTGLGLPISKIIITEYHKGTIEVESKPGQGTQLTIRLPL